MKASLVPRPYRRFALEVELVLDRRHRLRLGRGRLKPLHELHAPVPVEDRAQQVERTIDQPPGHVATEQRQGELEADDVRALGEQPGARGYCERHDQAEEHLEQRF